MHKKEMQDNVNNYDNEFNNKKIEESSEIENEAEQASTDITPLIKRSSVRSQLKDSILVKTLSFGLNGFFWSAFSTANSKLIAMLGNEGSGASTLVSSYRSVLFGTFTGLLLSTGLEIAPYLSDGNEDYIGAGDMAKTAWALTIISGGISSMAMLSTRWIFPLVFELPTAKAGLDFFTGCSIGTIPMLMIGTNVQIAFQADEWYIPPITTFLVFASASTCSYLLAFQGGLGAFGIGLGGSIAQWAVCLGMQAWFLRSPYKKYEFYRLSNIPDFGEKMKKLLNSGWKLSLQRITEWGNLMLIATVIGKQSNNALKATNPSAQYINLIATFLQGVAQAAGMLIKRNNKSRNIAMGQLNEQEAKKWHEKNVRTLVQCNLAVAALNGGIAVSFYFARKPLAKFFLASEIDSETEELAETLLWVNMLALIPDAIRIVSAGALRGWEDIIYPTMASLLLITVMGIPSGWALSKAFNDKDEYESEAAWMFYTRGFFMLAAALIIGNRCRTQILSSEAKIFSQFHNRDSNNRTSVIDVQHSVNTNRDRSDDMSSRSAIPSVKGKKLFFQPVSTDDIPAPVSNLREAQSGDQSKPINELKL